MKLLLRKLYRNMPYNHTKNLDYRILLFPIVSTLQISPPKGKSSINTPMPIITIFLFILSKVFLSKSICYYHLYSNIAFSKVHYPFIKLIASKNPCLYATFPYSTHLSFVANNAPSIIRHSSFPSPSLSISSILLLISFSIF